MIGRALANRYRGDLESLGLGSGHHGFEFTPPAGLLCMTEAIEVRRSLDGAMLGRSYAADAEAKRAERGVMSR